MRRVLEILASFVGNRTEFAKTWLEHVDMRITSAPQIGHHRTLMRGRVA